MGVILIGPSNKIALVAPGKPMLVGPLDGTATGGGSGSGGGGSGSGGGGSGSGGGGSGSGGGGTASLTSVAGLTGWWDAGVATNVLDPAGARLAAYGASAGLVADNSGIGAALTVWHQAISGATAPIATGHLNGILGGLGRNVVVPPNVASI